MLDTLATITVPTSESLASRGIAFPLRLRRAWPRAVARLGLQYIDAEGRTVPGQWHADDAQTKSLFRKLERQGQGAVLAVAGGSLVVLQPGGAENKLPALPGLLQQAGAELVTHRPGRRAVVRIEGAGGTRFAKALRPSRVGRIVRANRFVAEMAERAFEVASIERADEATGLLLMRSLAGGNLHDLAREDDGAFVDGCRAAGWALRSLHVAAPEWLPLHDASAEVAMLHERLSSVEAFVPDLNEVIAHASIRVFEGLGEVPAEMMVVHRDFYDKQIVTRGGDRPGLLDFDTLGAGEPALDVANMLGHLELRVLQGMCSQEVASGAARAFLAGYGADGATPARVGAYLDATRLRLAILYAFWPKWSGLSPRLLGMIGSASIDEAAGRISLVVPPRKSRHLSVNASSETAVCPLVFVVGCPRSGTTLLERMMDAHRDLAMTHETHWVTKHAKRRRDLTRNGCVRTDTLDRLYEDYRFARMAPPREEIDRLLWRGPLKYRTFVRLVFDYFRRQSGKALVGDKSTGGYLRNLPVLREVCPDSRIVHLVRDGRDVCLSMLNWPKASRAAGRAEMFASDPVATTAAWWQWHVRAGMGRGRPMGAGVYRELRYEALVAEPAGVCAGLCEFLGLVPDAGMAEFHAGRSEPGAGKSANAAWLPATPGLRDWRTQLTDEQIEVFEAVAGETLAELGYERRFPHITPLVAALAAERVERWEREIGVGQESRAPVDVVMTTGREIRQGEI